MAQFKQALKERGGEIQGRWDDHFCLEAPDTGTYVRDAFVVGGDLLPFLCLRYWKQLRWLAQRLSARDTITNYIPREHLVSTAFCIQHQWVLR
jgi:hypothetical protein